MYKTTFTPQSFKQKKETSVAQSPLDNTGKDSGSWLFGEVVELSPIVSCTRKWKGVFVISVVITVFFCILLFCLTILFHAGNMCPVLALCW